MIDEIKRKLKTLHALYQATYDVGKCRQSDDNKDIAHALQEEENSLNSYITDVLMNRRTVYFGAVFNETEFLSGIIENGIISITKPNGTVVKLNHCIKEGIRTTDLNVAKLVLKDNYYCENDFSFTVLNWFETNEEMNNTPWINNYCLSKIDEFKKAMTK